MKPFEKIGRFVIESERAAGAAATVFAARDHATGERVAVKVLRGLSAGDLARFRREVQTLAQIQHPAVVRYVDHGHTEDGFAYLVMEWLEGEDLRSRLARGRLEVREAALLGYNVAGALAVLHSHRLVHRDVKPGNIVLPGGSFADAKLVDFGLVRGDSLSAESAITAMGAVLGTPHYMSPEQARGQGALDARADIFSLGAVLYHGLTGRPPFEGNHIVTVLTKVLLQNAPPLRDLRRDIPQPLADLISSMLEKHPERRPGDAGAVARALAAIADSSAPRSDEGEPMSRGARSLTSGEQTFVSIVLAAGALRGEGEVSERGLAALVHQLGGRADLLLDGTLVVTFSGGGLVSDQALRAAQCALALRTVLPRSPMSIATGRAELQGPRPIGEAIERGALRLGEAIDEAAAAGPDRPPVIAIDDVTAALVEPRFDVAGAAGALRLGGARAVPSPARTLLGKVTPMLARDWELASIGTFFAETMESATALPLLVTGAAGMGKSRFAHEVAMELRGRFPALEVWWGQGDPVRTGSALGVLGQVIRSAAQVHEGEPVALRRSALERYVAARVPGEAWIAELLGEIAGAPFPAESSPVLTAARRDPRAMCERITAAWVGLVRATAGRGPLLLVLDDMQWIDPPTVRLVTRALAGAPDLPWMVLGLARPEVHDVFHRLWEEHDLQEIRLRPIPRRECARLAREALGASAGDETIQRLASQAEGNPFYLEELIVARAGGGGEPAGPSPQTVLGMAQARLSELDPEARRALRAASIFGDVVWVSGVTALLAGALPHAVIDALIQREILVPRIGSRFPGERELAFRHRLLREAAYATLTAADRVQGHALAGEWLERMGETDAMVLARHFEVGGERARAASQYLRAAKQALVAAEPRAAIERAEQALSELPTPEERMECAALLDHARTMLSHG